MPATRPPGWGGTQRPRARPRGDHGPLANPGHPFLPASGAPASTAGACPGGTGTRRVASLWLFHLGASISTDPGRLVASLPWPPAALPVTGPGTETWTCAAGSDTRGCLQDLPIYVTAAGLVRDHRRLVWLDRPEYRGRVGRPRVRRVSMAPIPARPRVRSALVEICASGRGVATTATATATAAESVGTHGMRATGVPGR